MNDTLAFIVAYERGDIESEWELAEGFQSLIDSGVVWAMRGIS